MKKKVLMTASTFPRWAGDTEPRFILDFARAMNGFYEVTVLVPAAEGAAEEEMLEGVHVIRYHYLPVHRWETLCYPGAIMPRIRQKKARALQVPFLLLALLRRVRKISGSYDLVHAHWIIPQGFIQSFAGARYLITGHGDDVTTMNRGILRRIKARSLRKAAGAAVVSGRLKQILREQYGIPEDRISVLPMGCDTSYFSPEYRDPELFPEKGRPHIVFAGRLVDRKGVRYLIEAMRDVDAELYIVGDGPEKESLQEQARPFGDRIHFPGRKTHEEIRAFFASADLCVFPSVHTENGSEEGFGLVIVEAMASGAPVVASRSGGITDIIRDGWNGLLAEEKNSRDLAEKINRLLEDRAYADSLAREGRKTAETYDYRAIAERYAAIYDRIAGS